MEQFKAAWKAPRKLLVLVLLVVGASCARGIRWPWVGTASDAAAAGPATSEWPWHHLALGWQGQQQPGGVRGGSKPYGSLAAAKAAFLAQHGSDYGYNGWLDRHWQQEVGVRLPGSQHYLDYTGAGMYATSQLTAATRLLAGESFGNPHSRNPSSSRSAQHVEAAERLVLSWLAADPKDFVLVWTRGATEALKLVGETFPWRPAADWSPSRGGQAGGVTNRTVGNVSKCGNDLTVQRAKDPRASHFIYTRANHKSVLGIGAYAADRGALLSCVDEKNMDDWLAAGSGGGASTGSEAQGGEPTYSLVAFPAKDNYEGVLYPLDWVKQVHAKSTRQHRWLVMLDAAAFVPTHPLNLTQVPADFVSISFYKVFGYPTGLGALVMRKESAALLHKVYFGGGSVDDATAEDVWRMLSAAPAGFQDGTVDFLGIAQLQYGFQLLQTLGGMQAVHKHVSSLQSWAYRWLSQLKHSSGQPLLTIFGHHGDAPARQSCLFQFLVHNPEGGVIGHLNVEQAAGAAAIHLRSGCHCNPGQCLLDLGIRPEEERAAALFHNASSGGFITVLRDAPGNSGRPSPVKLPTGSVRASLGMLSTFEDCYALVDWLATHYLDTPRPVSLDQLDAVPAAEQHPSTTAVKP